MSQYIQVSGVLRCAHRAHVHPVIQSLSLSQKNLTFGNFSVKMFKSRTSPLSRDNQIKHNRIQSVILLVSHQYVNVSVPISQSPIPCW